VPDRELADQLGLVEAMPLGFIREGGQASNCSPASLRSRACRSIVSTERWAAACAAAMPNVLSSCTVTANPHEQKSDGFRLLREFVHSVITFG
jgi:hypothetical protein